MTTADPTMAAEISAPTGVTEKLERDPDDLTVVPWDGDAGSWDRFMSRADDSTFCHLSGWRGVMEEVLGHETAYLVAIDGQGQWRGALPLVHVESALFGSYLLSMPFLNYGGPIGSSAARWALAGAAREAARDRKADLLELRTRRLTASPLQLSERKVTVLLDLPDEVEALWMGHLRGKVRTMVRKPRKEGMEIRFGTEQLGAFYEMYSVNMRDLGTPVLPRAFFEAVVAAFEPQVALGVVHAGEQPVAAGLGFLWQDEFEMTWASSLREYRRYTVNEFL